MVVRPVAETLERNKNACNKRASCKIQLRLQKVSGHDFSRAETAAKLCWALAPAVLVLDYLQFRSG
jgi:hypothetical protein